MISPFDVRQTNFIGGGVNAITKSGTNTFKGTAYVYHRNENMRGDAIEGEQIPGAREKDRTTTYGFTLGGPIIKNKLFFFANAEYSKTPSVAVRWRASENGVGNADSYLSYTTVADMERVQAHALEKYGYNTGSYNSFPADEDNTKILARIDWNITKRPSSGTALQLHQKHGMERPQRLVDGRRHTFGLRAYIAVLHGVCQLDVLYGKQGPLVFFRPKQPFERQSLKPVARHILQT